MSATTEAMCADGSSGYDHVYFNVEQMFCDVYDMLPRDYTTAAGDALAMSDHCPVIAEFTYI